MAIVPPTIINIKESDWEKSPEISWYCEVDCDSTIRIIFQKVPDNYSCPPIENAGSDLTISQVELLKRL